MYPLYAMISPNQFNENEVILRSILRSIIYLFSNKKWVQLDIGISFNDILFGLQKEIEAITFKYPTTEVVIVLNIGARIHLRSVAPPLLN